LADRISLQEIRFNNYKAFKKFSVALGHMNVLVEPNNAGKSTISGAFRILHAGIQAANARRIETVEGPGNRRMYGYTISPDAIPTSLENVTTDYVPGVDTTIEFWFTNG
jgi:predicted ATPase